MESASNLLFGDPTYIYLAGVVVAVLSVTAYVLNRRRWTLALAAGAAAVIPIAFLLDVLVVTDREQILDTVQHIASEFQAGRIDTLSGAVAEQYEGFGFDRETLLARAREEASRRTVQNVALTDIRVAVHGLQADMSLVTVVDAGDSYGGGRVPLAWDVTWRRIDDRWQIVRISTPRTVVPGYRVR